MRKVGVEFLEASGSLRYFMDQHTCIHIFRCCVCYVPTEVYYSLQIVQRFNLHQLTDSKEQLNINKDNSREFIYIARTNQKGCRGDEVARGKRLS